MKLVKVATQNYTVGFESNGTVLRAHRYLKFLLGKSDDLARSIIVKNGWRASVVADHTVTLVRDELLGSDPVKVELTIVPDADTQRPVHGKLIEQRRCFCGAVAHFGIGCSTLRGSPGTWFCAVHAVGHNKDVA